MVRVVGSMETLYLNQDVEEQWHWGSNGKYSAHTTFKGSLGKMRAVADQLVGQKTRQQAGPHVNVVASSVSKDWSIGDCDDTSSRFVAIS